MFGILPVVVEVDVGVGIEHDLFRLQLDRFGLTVDPLVHVEHGELVCAGVRRVIAVVCEVQAVVAVCFHVRGGVEEVVFRMRDNTLHFAFPQAAVDAEGE